MRFIRTSQKTHNFHLSLLASVNEPQSCQTYLATQGCSKAYTGGVHTQCCTGLLLHYYLNYGVTYRAGKYTAQSTRSVHTCLT